MGRLIAFANEYIGLAPERDREHNHVPWEFLGHLQDLLGSIDASYTIGKVLALIAEEERREHFEEELRLSRWAAEPEQAEQKAAAAARPKRRGRP